MKKKTGLGLLTAGLVLLSSWTPLWAEDTLELDLDPDYYGEFQGQNLSINVYNWGEYISDGSDGSLHVNKEFEKRTGIQVNYSTFATNEELYAKLQGGAVDYDVIIPSDYMAERMIREDMLQKIDLSHIPAFANLDPFFCSQGYDPDNQYTVPYTWGTVGIIYNQDLVEEEVDSWEILWTEKYMGNILMFSNPRDAVGIALKRRGYSLNTCEEGEIREAFEDLKQQKPLIQAYVMDEIFDKMQSGEAAIAPYYAGDAITMIAANPSLRFVLPKEGTNRFIDCICIPKGAKNPRAAELYINFLCEPEVAAANIDYIGYSTPNTAAKALLDEELQESPIAYPPQELLDKTELFLALPEETNLLLDQLWNELLSSRNEGGLSTILFVAGVGAAALWTSWKAHKRRKEDAYYESLEDSEK